MEEEQEDGEGPAGRGRPSPLLLLLASAVPSFLGFPAKPLPFHRAATVVPSFSGLQAYDVHILQVLCIMMIVPSNRRRERDPQQERGSGREDLGAEERGAKTHCIVVECWV